MTEFSKDRSDLTYHPWLPIPWSLLFLSQPNSYISASSPLMISIDLSMEALNLLPSRCHRFMRSTSAARRRILVSIFSQSLHFWPTGTVCIISFIPHVSPILYCRLQCCRKWPHFQSPHTNRCWSKKHIENPLLKTKPCYKIYRTLHGLGDTV